MCIYLLLPLQRPPSFLDMPEWLGTVAICTSLISACIFSLTCLRQSVMDVVLFLKYIFFKPLRLLQMYSFLS